MQVLSRIEGFRAKAIVALLLGVLTLAGCGGSSSSSGVTATPTLSPGAGTYATSQPVTIASATANAVLYCTTDGTTPTTSSPKCAQPTTVYQTEFLQAIAVASGKSPSAVASAGYVINLNAAPTPAFTPTGGTYSGAQQVTINDTLSGANIYYTLDGTMPTTNSTLYTGAITISQSATLNAIATSNGYANSGVASAAYTIVPPAAVPTFSPAGGSYTSAQAVTIADTTRGAIIYYTTNGTPATANSTPYTSPVPVTQSETINAIAVAPGYSSTTASAIYSINLQQASAPTFSLANNQLTISDATAGATIYYTTDGSQPNASSPLHGAAPLTITVTAGETVNAMAAATGYGASPVATYTVSLSAASQPTFSLVNNQLTISDTTAGATIYYTTDGTQPSASSPLHGAAPVTIAVTAGQTVNAIAVATGYTNSAVATYAVTAAPTPSFTLASNQLTIGDTAAGATIYYTIDGTQPSTSSSLHGAAPVTITVTAGEAVNAIAVASNYVSSAIGTFTTKSAQPPSFSLTGSQLTISDTTTGATIYYTTDGTQPTTSSPLSGNSPITITVTAGEVVNAIAAAPNYLNSAAENYTIGVTGTPEFSLSSGNLTINDATSGAVIYYTINGSAPTTSSPLHGTAPVTVAVSIGDIVQAIALAPGNTVSAPASYTVKANAATPQITPNGGYVISSQVPVSVSITETSSGATVYYTTDGTAPSATNGTAYAGSFTVSPTASSPIVTVKAIAVGSNYNDSGEADSTFTLLASPTISGQVVSGSASGPISGATVQLFTAGTTGYASAPSTSSLNVIGNLTTDANGKFALAYTCPAAPGDQLYVVATTAAGGGFNGGTNPSIALMTALGSCGNLNTSGTTVTINEVTTIAAAYALSGFAGMPTTGGGINVGAPAVITAKATTCKASGNWVSSGPNTCNYLGLVNAFNTANNLVDPSTGQARTFTPGYTQSFSADTNIINNSTVPTARINALADMLASCVETPSGCGTLFAAAATTNVTPADTLQTALNIAQNPGNNVTALLGLVASSFIAPPYATNLGTTESTPPTDLTLALTFTGAGLGIAPNLTLADPTNPSFLGTISVTNSALAIDAQGNIWVTGYPVDGGSAIGNTIAEFSGLGAPLTPNISFSTATPQVPTFGGFNPTPTNDSGLGVFAIDQSGNLWINGQGSDDLLEVSSSLAPSQSVGSLRTGDNGSIAIDLGGRAWAGGREGGLEQIATGDASVLQNFANAVPLGALTFDANGGLWGVSRNGTNSDDVLQIDTATGNDVFAPFSTLSGFESTTLVADGLGNVYGCDPTETSLYAFNNGAIVSPYPFTLPSGMSCGSQLVLDGQSHIFAVLNTGAIFPMIQTVYEFSTTGAALSPLAGYTGTSSAEVPTLNPDYNLGTQVPGIGAAIDGSGNLWVLNQDTAGADSNFNVIPGNVLVEYVGIGAPVLTPTSVAQTNGVLGARP